MGRLETRNNFGKLMNELGLKGNGVEIGVGHGNFSNVWISSCPLEKIFLIDPWKSYEKGKYLDGNNTGQITQDKRYKLVTKKMSKYGDRVEIIRKESLEVVENFSDQYFDFIYIDANHEYKWVKEDLLAWYPKLKKGGIFSGHDYKNCTGSKKNRWGEVSLCGVKQAVDEFCNKLNMKTSVTGGTRRCPASWYFIK